MAVKNEGEASEGERAQRGGLSHFQAFKLFPGVGVEGDGEGAGQVTPALFYALAAAAAASSSAIASRSTATTDLNANHSGMSSPAEAQEGGWWRER